MVKPSANANTARVATGLSADHSQKLAPPESISVRAVDTGNSAAVDGFAFQRGAAFGQRAASAL